MVNKFVNDVVGEGFQHGGIDSGRCAWLSPCEISNSELWLGQIDVEFIIVDVPGCPVFGIIFPLNSEFGECRVQSNGSLKG